MFYGEILIIDGNILIYFSGNLKGPILWDINAGLLIIRRRGM